ncbi:hypothetical protein ABGB17_19150 [Sphaerisporangium sp. B11E5]|uniref:hypothetical protein n=1 Tax=Sphaerisporangium sp. B11E5 TaxID=3153563 RepID=UPI00325F422F
MDLAPGSIDSDRTRRRGLEVAIKGRNGMGLKKLTRYCAALALLAGASVVAASPAQAASTICVVVVTSCTTGSIPASSEHWIYYYYDSGVSASGCSARIRDTGTNAIVYSGRVGVISHRSGYVYGLYGRYRMEMYNCGNGSVGYLKNSIP